MKMKLLKSFTASACLLTANATSFEDKIRRVAGCFDYVNEPITLEMARSIRPNSCLVYGHTMKVPIEIINYVLDNELTDVNYFDVYGMNSITYALIRQDYKAADALLAHGADLNAFSYSIPMVQIMLWENLSDSDATKAVNFLLDHNASPYSFGRSGVSPLSAAAKRSPELVKLFLNLGLDPNYKNRFGITVLHQAISGHLNHANTFEVVKLLVDHGADMSLMDNEDETPVFSSVKNRHFKVFDFFMQNLKNEGRLSLLNAPNRMGKTVFNFYKDEMKFEKEHLVVTEIISKYI